ncbi:hypothetical protein ACIA8R_29690 [Nonomuraea sp. NPDC051191]|uniref:hypothetical protein n=1 Tax=Nonomuraea sp. NPDC051191 TaxID=3364372 RepID=UPI0037A1172A
MGLHTVTMGANATNVRVLKADDPALGDLFDGSPPDGYVITLTGHDDEAVVCGSHIEIAAIVRKLAVEARHRFAGSGVATVPNYSLHVYAIAAHLRFLCLVPDEEGALLAAGQILDHLRGAGFDLITRADEPDVARPAPLPVLWPGADVTPELLKPGRIVQRYPERSRGGRWISVMPCCGRAARLPDPPGDEEKGGGEGVAVFCNACKILYTLRWQQEPDEGWGPSWLASFEVTHTKVATATGNYRKGS